MSPGPTFDRVYLALKEQLTSGRFLPGDHLEPSALGEELNASITPVRDALHRLVGERIVEAPRSDGFRVPAPTEAELRDLYGWNLELLELGLRRRRTAQVRVGVQAPEREIPGDAVAAGAADLFRAIARHAGNPEHEAAIESLNDRMGALRVAEGRLFGDLEAELSGMQTAFEAGDARALRRSIAAYHRRRQRHAPEILLALRGADGRR